MTRPDLYPSRTGGAAEVLQRKDPVVHSSGVDRAMGPLSRRELAAYEEQGFLSLPALLEPAEVALLADEVDRLFRVRRGDPSPAVVREPEDDEVRSIFAVHETESTFRDLVRHPKVLALAVQLLGDLVYVHQSRINYKPAFRGQPFYWHSDFETWHVEDGMPRMRAFSLSLNLTENRPENGPLLVIPGSHHCFVACAGATPEAHYERSLRRQEAGLPPEDVLSDLAEARGVSAPTGPPGSATIFDCNLMHGSNGNITPFSRTNLFLVFNRVDNALEAPFSGQPPRPPHIANRHPVPLQ